MIVLAVASIVQVFMCVTKVFTNTHRVTYTNLSSQKVRLLYFAADMFDPFLKNVFLR